MVDEKIDMEKELEKTLDEVKKGIPHLITTFEELGGGEYKMRIMKHGDVSSKALFAMIGSLLNIDDELRLNVMQACEKNVFGEKPEQCTCGYMQTKH